MNQSWWREEVLVWAPATDQLRHRLSPIGCNPAWTREPLDSFLLRLAEPCRRHVRQQLAVARTGPDRISPLAVCMNEGRGVGVTHVLQLAQTGRGRHTRVRGTMVQHHVGLWIIEWLDLGLLVLDDEFQIVYANEALSRLLGIPLPELLALDPGALLGEADGSDWRQDAARDVRRLRDTTVLPLRRRDGSTQMMRVTAVLAGKGRGRREGPLVIVQDSGTESRRARQRSPYDARLRLLSVELARARESERRALARELHDGVGQALLALRLDLERATRPRANAERLTAIRGAIAAVDAIIGDHERLVTGLRPQVLDVLSLRDALGWLVEDLAARSDIRIRHAGLECLPPEGWGDGSDHVFRIAQEALANAIRHSGATRVDVTARWHPDGYEITIRDDGSGFDAEGAKGVDRHGVLSMEERAAALGGWLTVESGRGRGTAVVLTVPAPPGAPA